MNPFLVNKMINESSRRMCVDFLSERCEVRLRHKDVLLSEEVFVCPHCGMERHYVKKLTASGFVSLLFR